MENNLTELLYHGESTEVLKELEDNSVDSVVCDPPYGLSKEPDITKVLSEWVSGDPSFVPDGKGFMSKDWDGFVPPPSLWREVYRVLKPGGHALVFAGTRTQDLMTISLRLAGFEVRDVIEWIYFSGFPKSHNVSKAFDRRAGAVREVVGRNPRINGWKASDNTGETYGSYGKSFEEVSTITEPATELARKWAGWGTNLKPAHEPIIMVRKPLHDGRKMTVVDCVEKYGTGAINIDASRIATEDTLNYSTSTVKGVTPFSTGTTSQHSQGRFPANCITLDSGQFDSKYFNISPAELSKKANRKDRNSDWMGNEIDVKPSEPKHVYGDGLNSATKELKEGDKEAVEKGQLPKGRSLVKNNHPTVKPTDLMAWLIKLVAPPNGVDLEPFVGSGSTLVAAKREGFNFIGIELEDEYIPIIEARTGTDE